MYKAIEAMMIIHNICIDLQDKPDDNWDFKATDRSDSNSDDGMGGETIEGEAEVLVHETENWLMKQGRQKQLILLDELFPE
jgi:hypothetical protein